MHGIIGHLILMGLKTSFLEIFCAVIKFLLWLFFFLWETKLTYYAKKFCNARIIWLTLGQLDEVNVTMMRGVIIGATLLPHWWSDRVSVNSYTDKVKFEGVLSSSPRLIKTYRLILAFWRLRQVNREQEDFGYAEKGGSEKRFLIVKTI